MGGVDASQPTKSDITKRLLEAQRLFELGNALAAQGRIDQAILHYEHALSLRPDYAEAHNNLGNARALQGQTEQAVAYYERALSLRPDYAEAHYNLGRVRALQGQTDPAAAHYERALSLRPNYPEAHCNLGHARVLQGQIDQAILHYERALSRRPDYAEAHCNLGNARALQGQTDRAVVHFERALSLRSEYAEAHCSLGNARAQQGQIDRAVAHFERALSLRPDYAEAYSNMLFAMNYASDKNPVDVFTAHLNFGRRWESPLVTPVEAPANSRQSGRRLRIGYVSSDFRQHSVSYFIEPVLAHHDHEQFEIFCYANCLQEDRVTERLKSQADHWRRLVGQSDEQAAQQIRVDQIDILVDLNGHTANNRLLLFARKPAPIQVTWLGYPNTTGLSAMDYRITDGFADPVGTTEHLHSEDLVRLPQCFSCYQPPRDAPEVSGLPAQEKGYLSFGCFNNMAKITVEVMAAWASILHAVPGSHLVLKNAALSGDPTRRRVRRTFAEMGIAPDRLELRGRDQSQRAHLERYRNIDIGLDTFPYNGATTTCEALWMGVPVVTLAEKTHAGRVGVSQLSNLGLTELVSHTVEEYVSVAQQLAADLNRLGDLRAELRSRLAASPLTDGQRFTKNLEQTYFVMWQNWCRQTSPPHVSRPNQ